MSSKESKTIYGVDYSRCHIREDTLDGLIWKFINANRRLAEAIGYDWNRVYIDIKAVVSLIKMVERRRVYFWVFHGDELGELNETCLQVFWMLKYKPFFDYKKIDGEINYQLAINKFLNALQYESVQTKREYALCEDYFNQLNHAFRKHDISKEAIQLLAQAAFIKSRPKRTASTT